MIVPGELTDQQWAVLHPLLPVSLGRRGGQWVDHRQVINGILWRLRTGAPWRMIPSQYGRWSTCHDRYTRWRRDGTWNQILEQLRADRETLGEAVPAGQPTGAAAHGADRGPTG